MTDEKKPPEGQEPPKIKLPGLSDAAREADESETKESTAKVPLSSAQPPPGSGEPPKSRTTKIELSSAKPPAAADATKEGTTKIELGDAKPPEQTPDTGKKRTTKIDLSEAKPPAVPAQQKKKTTKLSLSDAKPPAETPASMAEKARTARIDVADAKPPAEEGIQEDAVPDATKNQTMRIELSADDMGEDIQEFEVPEAAKQATQRIIIEDEEKKRTSRVDLPKEDEADEDALKRRTGKVSSTGVVAPAIPSAAPPPSSAPKTIKLKRSDTPATKILKKPPVTADQDASSEDARKGETARLDLPDDVEEGPPASRPKTVRIKRPDPAGTTRKPLKVNRPGESAPSDTPKLTALEQLDAMGEEEEGPGAAAGVLSLVAVLVALVVVYILLAQTYLPDLPYPGRL